MACSPAALACYTMFSLAPLLLIVISVSGLVFGEDAAAARFRHSPIACATIVSGHKRALVTVWFRRVDLKLAPAADGPGRH